MLGFSPLASGPLGDTGAGEPPFILTGVDSVSIIGTVTVSANASTSTTGVEATGQVDTNVFIQLESAPVIDGVQGTAQAGTITVSGKAVFNVVGTVGTSNITAAAALAEANVNVSGIELSGTVSEDLDIGTFVTIVLDSVAGTFNTPTPNIDAQAVTIVNGVSAQNNINTVTVDAFLFDYEAIKDQYSRNRTVYVNKYSNLSNIVYVEAENRTLYVENSTSEYRTVYARAA